MTEIADKQLNESIETDSDPLDAIISEINDLKHRLIGCLPLSQLRRYTDGNIRDPGGAAQAARYLDEARDLLRRSHGISQPNQHDIAPNMAVLALDHSLAPVPNIKSHETQQQQERHLSEDDIIYIMKVYTFFVNRIANRVGMRISVLCGRLLVNDRDAFVGAIEKAVNIGFLQYVESEDDDSDTEMRNMVVKPANEELLLLYAKNRNVFLEELMTR
jgi:hypothetical protein